jgi:signal transduction histidine kinase
MKSKKNFSADASHELRTPLSVIFSSIEVLEKAGEKRSPFEREVLQGLKEEACQMNQLVSDLLLLARADNPYVQQISKESFDLAKLIEKVINKLTPLAEEKGIDLTWAGESVQVEGDQGKLEQVLTILIDNGFNYNQDGGWIRVELVEKRKEILLKVSDNGKGIPKEHQPKIFDRFYRAEVSRVQEPQGTGLGLSIAYELVRLHGGKIEVISEIGKGSTFTVTLPRG